MSCRHIAGVELPAQVGVTKTLRAIWKVRDQPQLKGFYGKRFPLARESDISRRQVVHDRELEARAHREMAGIYSGEIIWGFDGAAIEIGQKSDARRFD